jgi:molybdenum cofactor synthesis domain-containing protein
MGVEKMKPFGELVSRQDALDRINKTIVQTKKTEKVVLLDSVGRITAKNIIADFDVPPFNRSAMDGYAVRSSDTQGAQLSKPIRLKLIGEIHAGEQFEGVINTGECVEIATGSPVPVGSDSVVMVENTRIEDSLIEIYQSVDSGENVAPQGEDIKKGEVVIKAGDLITPGKLGAIAALGLENVAVIAKPRIAVYSTGTEIVPQGQRLKSGQIYDINSYTLSSIISRNGCEPFKIRIVKDDYESLKSEMSEISKYDMAVFSGGSSVGTRDLLRLVIEEVGEIIFHGVRVKPGKPTLFGVVDKTPVFGMPGFPTSCLSNAYVFLTPALRKLARLPREELRIVKASLTHKVKGSPDREMFYTVKVENDKATPAYKQSGDITSMAHANGFFVVPVGASLEAGAEVEVILLN